MDRTKMTVVFEVKDREAMKQLYEAHKAGSLICGMSPNILAWGDCITTPDEIIGGLLEVDVESINKKEIGELVTLAEKYRGVYPLLPRITP